MSLGIRVILVAVLGVLGCHRAPLPSAEAAPSAVAAKSSQPVPPAAHDVTVFAAASLRESFTEVGKAFERAHPEAHVVLSFAGSQTLRAQIEHGAPADVFASADQRHMNALVAEKQVLEPHVFAKNELVMVVAKAQSAALRELSALPKAQRIVLGAPEVPVGEYTRLMLEKAAHELGADFPKRVEAHVVSREPDVRQVLAKVVLGEADAGIVYRTDALTAKDKLSVVTIPSAINVVAEYPIAVTVHAPAPELGRAFVELLLSAEGARLLEAQGFAPGGERAATP